MSLNEGCAIVEKQWEEYIMYHLYNGAITELNVKALNLHLSSFMAVGTSPSEKKVNKKNP